MTNGNDLAFPATAVETDPIDGSTINKIDSFGLTKREYFAAMAMQGLCANSIPGNHHKPETLCKDAVEYTNALIKELDK